MKQESQNNKSFLFQVELMVEGTSNRAALEQVIKALNQASFLDYRITSGVQLGQLIEQKLAESTQQHPIPITQALPDPSPKQAATKEDNSSSGLASIRTYMKSNKLIRLIVNKGLGITLSIPCRIINIDEGTSIVTVYHVDEKQVYSFRLNEIEDFQE